mgnify:CR=1 FL=1
MHRRFLSAALFLIALPVVATNEDPLAVVAELGRLNGEALACSQSAISNQAKKLMIGHAPKTRRYGEVFEEQTNSAFLAQGKDARCQTAEDFSRRLDDLATRLQQWLPVAATPAR